MRYATANGSTTSTASTESATATTTEIVKVVVHYESYVTTASTSTESILNSLAVDVVVLAIIHIPFAVDEVQPFVNVCLRDIFSCDDLANAFILLEDCHLLRTANTASKREDTTFTRVGIRRRVSDTERAVNAMTIFQLRATPSAPLVMARLAEIVSAKAAEESN